ncbi:class F sortase [Frigoribacterium sp. RIT-PI-h]|uniref:class F sortase n=1 Tax=Frigoribacterium sp. RIT-PI-h TaxID=1690245 RepID=UPI000B235184|nr:class F sortase [Frigoribacterium sp. RIT-PI-h]
MSLATFVTGHRAAALAVGAALVLVAGGVTAAAVADRPDDTGTSTAATSSATATPDPASGSAGAFQDPAAPSSPAPRADAAPVRVPIPPRGVDSGPEARGLGARGEPDPPKEWQSAGWYQDGAVPGAGGPAVIAGHVDSGSGPAVFVDLAKLVPGDEVQVTLSTGSVATLRVTGSERTPQATSPTSDVYGASPPPRLRLITRDGPFARSTGHYVDNLIVFADLVTS